MSDEESTKVKDLRRQLAAERDGRMRAEALLDDARRANDSLRQELVEVHREWIDIEL